MPNTNFTNKNKFKFIVSFDGDSSNFEFFAKGFNFGGLSVGTTTFMTPIRGLNFTGDSFNVDDVSVDFLIDENWESYKELFYWLKRLKNSTTGRQELTLLAEISVTILNTKFRDSFSFVLKECKPYALTQVAMDVDDDNSPMMGNVVFKVGDFDIIDKN
jgi:hypothetical protein